MIQTKTFTDLGLAPPLLRALDKCAYAVPTPIQTQAIPPLLARRDLLGIAQTGTGKTAAFALPLLQHLSSRRGGKRRRPRGLILAPTRELAIQIGADIAAYGCDLDLRVGVISGGVRQQPQVAALRRGIDVLVATPGRLLDLLGQGRLHLDAIEHFVLDEADRMLDMGFIRDVRRIERSLPRRRQNLLFSATMPREVEHLAHDLLFQPIQIDVVPKTMTVERVDQRVYFVDPAAKRALLDDLLRDPALARVIVFTRTKHRANRVARQITQSGVAAEAIHGNKSQAARQRSLARFRAGTARVLVATDIAARGLDIDDVSHVVNYELPNVPESYIHRIGRTARAGADGTALSFCSPEERTYLEGIERLTCGAITMVEDELGRPPKCIPKQNAEPRRARPRNQHRVLSGERTGEKAPAGKSPSRFKATVGVRNPAVGSVPRADNTIDRPGGPPSGSGRQGRRTGRRRRRAPVSA